MVARLLVAVLVPSLIAACISSTSDLLSVQTPDNVPATLFDDPANAILMVNGVIGDFECALGSFIVGEGLASDELHDGTTGNNNWALDRRDNLVSAGRYGTTGCTASTGIYTPLATARAEADQAIARLAGWTDAQVVNRQTLIAQSNLYAAFSYALLGMAMCQAAFDLGPLVDQKGMFALAEARFTDAIAAAQAASQATLLNAARTGRARVRLYQHNTAGAIADAQLVPKGFVFNASTDALGDSRRVNRVFQAISAGRTATVEAATRALTTENGEVDSRSATTKLTTTTGDGLQPVYIPTKYNAASQSAGQAIPMPIARYEEAQLILAEAQSGATAVSIVNTLRAAVNLKPYTGASDAASIATLISAERQRVLFVEGFRAFDVERFVLPFVPAAGAAYEKGGSYGETVCLPVPDVERDHNPNIIASQIISGVRGQFTPP